MKINKRNLLNVLIAIGLTGLIVYRAFFCSS